MLITTVLYFSAFVSSIFSIKTGDKIVYFKPPATLGDLSEIAIAVVAKVMPGEWPVFLSTDDTIQSTYMVKKSVRGYPDLPPPQTSSSDSDDERPNCPGFRPLDVYHLIFGGDVRVISAHRAIGATFWKAACHRIDKMRQQSISKGGLLLEDAFFVTPG